MLTARDQVGDRVHGLDLGADDYLAKPFAMAELGARVPAHLRGEQLDLKESIIHWVASWDNELSLNAIEVYVSRLRAKLEPAGIRIRTVRVFGYMLEEFRAAA